jgi:hypothetical protein
LEPFRVPEEDHSTPWHNAWIGASGIDEICDQTNNKEKNG